MILSFGLEHDAARKSQALQKATVALLRSEDGYGQMQPDFGGAFGPPKAPNSNMRHYDHQRGHAGGVEGGGAGGNSSHHHGNHRRNGGGNGRHSSYKREGRNGKGGRW